MLRTTRASTATRIFIRTDLHNELTRPDLVSTRPDLVSTLFHSTTSGITRPDVVPLCFHSSLSGLTRPDLVFTRSDLALLSGTLFSLSRIKQMQPDQDKVATEFGRPFIKAAEFGRPLIKAAGLGQRLGTKSVCSFCSFLDVAPGARTIVLDLAA